MHSAFPVFLWFIPFVFWANQIFQPNAIQLNSRRPIITANVRRQLRQVLCPQAGGMAGVAAPVLSPLVWLVWVKQSQATGLERETVCTRHLGTTGNGPGRNIKENRPGPEDGYLDSGNCRSASTAVCEMCAFNMSKGTVQ